jgi:fructose-1,6-bisphosphatase/inositol monophosphatase family enzyme
LQPGQAVSDVFTEADIRIQKTIEYNLKMLYPRAKIIGEEDALDKNYEYKNPYILPD